MTVALSNSRRRKAYYVLHDVSANTYSKHLIRADANLDLRRLFQPNSRGELKGPAWYNRSISRCSVNEGVADAICILMEKLDMTLQQFMFDRNTTVEPIKDVGKQIGTSLDTLDENRILHRDLHFGNIMLKKRKDHPIRVYLIDFGNAYDMTNPGSVRLITNSLGKKSEQHFYDRNPEYTKNYTWFKTIPMDRQIENSRLKVLYETIDAFFRDKTGGFVAEKSDH